VGKGILTLSDATKTITRALEELGNLYGFRVKKGGAPRTAERARLRTRVDVTFRLPDGRPVFRFEIDNATHRRTNTRPVPLPNRLCVATAVAVYARP